MSLDMSVAFNSVDARMKIPKLQQLGLGEIATKLVISCMTGIENVTQPSIVALLGEKYSFKGYKRLITY